MFGVWPGYPLHRDLRHPRIESDHIPIQAFGFPLDHTSTSGKDIPLSSRQIHGSLIYIVGRVVLPSSVLQVAEAY